jgi:hypothetical protein
VKRVLILVLVVLVAAMATTGAADAKAKTWKKVITCTGKDEQYTDQYNSKPFKLLGGKQKMSAVVVPDPELEEQDMEEWWSANWFVQQIGGWHSAYMMMDGEENPDLTLTARFKLPKGRYFIDPSSANLVSWTVTLWEWR